ncbi:MAG: lipid-A-disaccharide synthase, partial [Calditrichales bacterium]
MTKKTKSAKLVIVAGEVSGDVHGARLITALKQRNPDLEIYGIGGDLMVAEGLQPLFHIKEMAFLGVGEVIRHLPFILRVFKEMEALVERVQPSAVILIDYPGFNIRFARKMKKRGVPVIYYISPQLWAWGKKRVFKIKKYVEKMLVIFPFEKTFYTGYGIESEYVGHPLVDRHYQSVRPKTTGAGDKILGLLPGSRRQELEKLFPDMLKAAYLMVQAGEIAKAKVLKVNTIPLEEYKRYIGSYAGIEIYDGPLPEFYNGLDAALVSSGTATLETAYFQVPLVIVYRVNSLTWFLGKRLVKLDQIGLA